MSRGRLFGSLCSMVFLMNLGRVVFAPLLEPLRVAFDASGTTLGVIATLVWLGSALPRIPTGYLLTRAARHRVILGTGVLLTAATGFTAAARTVPVLMLGAFLMGLASGSYLTAANPLVSELFPERVGRAIGVHGTAAQLAAAGAPLLVSAALVVGSWRTSIQAMAALAFAVTVVFAAVARRADLPAAGTEDRDLVGAIRHQWPVVLASVAVFGATGLVWNGVFNFYVTYLHAVKGLPEGTARTLLTVVFGAGVPAFLVTGRLADRVPPLPLMLSITAGFVCCLAALTVVEGLVALGVVSVALGYVIHGMFPAVDTYLLGSLPDRHRASAYAAFTGVVSVVMATGSSVVGAVTDAGVPFDAVFGGAAAGLAVVLLVLVGTYLTGRLPAGARA